MLMTEAAAGERLTQMLDVLADFVRAESSSEDPAALKRCAEVVAGHGERILGVTPEITVTDGVPLLRWGGRGTPRVLLIAHYDTVWPTGTIDVRDFGVENDRAYGPGVFDMKAGIVQTLFAVAQTGLDGVEILVTGDEEVGSLTSTSTILERSATIGTVLIPEPAAGPSIKIERKGTIQTELRLTGRASHAGLEPEAGVSTTLAIGPIVAGAVALVDVARGTTVTPTLVRSGTVVNAVPDVATIAVDVRATSSAELDRVEAGLKALGDGVELLGFEAVVRYRREPLTAQASAELFAQARAVAQGLGLPELTGVAVGGCSDGNLAAAAGARTLDGLGPVGGGAHAESEFIEVAELEPRARVLAGLIDALRSTPSTRSDS